MPACLCGHNVLCPIHPRCPYCKNEVTVFASGRKEFTCTRCKKLFDKKTVVPEGSCTTLDHIYPAPKKGQTVRKCYCGKRSLKVNRNLDMPFYTAESVDTPMAKNKTVKLTKSAKKSAVKTAATRVSNLLYRWVKELKDAPTTETTYGTIYQTMRKLKKGTLAEVTDAAVKNGLTKFSDQDPTKMVRIHLRYMVNGGAVSQSRNGVEVAASAPKKSAKKEVKAKKSFKLVKK